MAGRNRHLRGDTKEILAPVRGNITIDPGDLMYMNTSVNNNAYPFGECKDPTTATEVALTILVNFLGVAMDGSLAGVTEKISIATDGVFRFPLVGGRLSGVTLGSKVSAVSPSQAGAGVSSAWVVNHSVATGAGIQHGTTAYLGYCVKTESGASYVDFQIKTMPSGSTIPGN